MYIFYFISDYEASIQMCVCVWFFLHFWSLLPISFGFIVFPCLKMPQGEHKSWHVGFPYSHNVATCLCFAWCGLFSCTSTPINILIIASQDIFEILCYFLSSFWKPFSSSIFTRKQTRVEKCKSIRNDVWWREVSKKPWVTWVVELENSELSSRH